MIKKLKLFKFDVGNKIVQLTAENYKDAIDVFVQLVKTLDIIMFESEITAIHQLQEVCVRVE